MNAIVLEKVFCQGFQNKIDLPEFKALRRVSRALYDLTWEVGMNNLFTRKVEYSTGEWKNNLHDPNPNNLFKTKLYTHSLEPQVFIDTLHAVLAQGFKLKLRCANALTANEALKVIQDLEDVELKKEILTALIGFECNYVDCLLQFEEFPNLKALHFPNIKQYGNFLTKGGLPGEKTVYLKRVQFEDLMGDTTHRNQIFWKNAGLFIDQLEIPAILPEQETEFRKQWAKKKQYMEHVQEIRLLSPSENAQGNLGHAPEWKDMPNLKSIRFQNMLYGTTLPNWPPVKGLVIEYLQTFIEVQREGEPDRIKLSTMSTPILNFGNADFPERLHIECIHFYNSKSLATFINKLNDRAIYTEERAALICNAIEGIQMEHLDEDLDLQIFPKFKSLACLMSRPLSITLSGGKKRTIEWPLAEANLSMWMEYRFD